MKGTNQQDMMNALSGKPESPLSEEMLLAYMEGRLSADEKHKVEQWLSEDGFEHDAIEGAAMLDAEDIKTSVKNINTKLDDVITKGRRKPKHLRNDTNTIIAIIIIILMAIMAYAVIYFLKHKQ